MPLAPLPTPAPAAPNDRDDDIRRILDVARSFVGMDVAWASRFDAADQVFTHVVANGPEQGPQALAALDLAGSYCVRVLDGRLPALIPDVSGEPVARDLPVTQTLGIGSYAGVPIRNGAGALRGMLCCTSSSATPALTEAARPMLEMLAQVVGVLLDPSNDEAASALRESVLRAVSGHGRTHVLQPIVDIRTGRAAGFEGLARFADTSRRVDGWFAAADGVGLLFPLEVAAARSALASQPDHAGYISVNLSPSTILAGGLDLILAGFDSARVVIEITEHAAVEDYAAVEAALRPHREAGARLAIDDAGAGYASFRHILQLQPDYIKIDLSLVRDIHLDPVRQALTSSLVAFGHTAGATLIAEGVETQAELDTLARLGVTLMQGYLLGRPSPDPASSGYPGVSRHVLVEGERDISHILATALRNSGDLEEVTRPLLDAVLRVTGLETSYLTVRRDSGALEHRYVRNAGAIDLPEGFDLPWGQSLCSAMQSRNLTWTNDPRDLADRPVAAAHDVCTYVTLPLTALDGTLLGTLCAGSRQPLFLSDATIGQLQLIAHVLSAELRTTKLADRHAGA